MSVILGIGISFIGTLCSASGYTFQKYTHNKISKTPEIMRVHLTYIRKIIIKIENGK